MAIQIHYFTWKLFIVLLFLYCFLTLFQVWQIDKFWRATCLFTLFKSNLCEKLRTNLWGSFIFLFSVFMNIFFHAYILTIVAQSHFFVLFPTKDSLLMVNSFFLCSKFSSTSLSQSKLKQKLSSQSYSILLL